MPSERQAQGSLSQEYILQALSARAEPGAIKPDETNESYMVSFGDTEHPAWMRVWPEGGGVALESDWGRLEIEGVTRVSLRRGRLWLESPQEGERLVVEVSPTGMWRAGRGVLMPSGEVELQPMLGQSMKEGAEGQRITLRGYVGSAARFRETPQAKQLVASFPLGVHPDADTTEWYTVVVFGDRAQRIKDKPLSVGQEVEVVGYIHERERRTRSGDTKLEQQVYAAAVRTSLSSPRKS